tara:strand:+ start:452 stop:1081 length:630 start_codon:yes stop_codon:yes gene_type:complete
MKVDLYNLSGKKMTKKTSLNDKVFKIIPNEHSIYLAVKSELAAKRQGTSSSKTRSEVRGGGTKPWKQKGTGRSRIGSLRNPSRVHGGSAFGPKPHKYNLKVNKKVKLLARKSALSIKVSTESYKIIDQFNLKTNKTKDFVEVLKNLNIEDNKIILITSEENDNLYLSSRNLEKINLVNVNTLSTYDIMNSNFLLVDEGSVEFLNNNYIK